MYGVTLSAHVTVYALSKDVSSVGHYWLLDMQTPSCSHHTPRKCGSSNDSSRDRDCTYIDFVGNVEFPLNLYFLDAACCRLCWHHPRTELA